MVGEEILIAQTYLYDYELELARRTHKRFLGKQETGHSKALKSSKQVSMLQR